MLTNETPIPPPAPKPTNTRRRLIYILLALVITLAILDLVFFWSKSPQAATPTRTPEVALATLTPSSAPPTTSAPTVETGWTIHKKDTFQLALPSSWQELSLDDTTLKQEIDAVSQDNPHLADQLRGILSSGQNKNFVFYAADTSNQGNVVSNVSVARTSVPAGMSVTQVAQEFANALPQMLKGAKVVSTNAPLTINGQQAAEVDYDLPLVNSAGQVVTVRGIQYIFVPKTGDAYVLTISGDASQADQWTPVAHKIGESFVIQ